MTRRLRAATATPANPTVTESQLAAELERKQEAQRSAAITVCGRAIRDGWDRADVVQVLRSLGTIPDPEAGVPGKYAWGQVKRGQQ